MEFGTRFEVVKALGGTLGFQQILSGREMNFMGLSNYL